MPDFDSLAPFGRCSRCHCAIGLASCDDGDGGKLCSDCVEAENVRELQADVDRSMLYYRSRQIRPAGKR